MTQPLEERRYASACLGGCRAPAEYPGGLCVEHYYQSLGLTYKSPRQQSTKNPERRGIRATLASIANNPAASAP